MTPSQFSFLEQEIISEIDERRDLMLRLKVLLKRIQLDTDKQLFLSYSIPIVYSVWEGFVKAAFQIYIKELNKLSISINDVCDSIFVYYMESSFPQLKKYPQDFKDKVKLFNNLQKTCSNNTLYIYLEVNTESNVNFKVLNRLLNEFNLAKIKDYIEPKYSLASELDGFLLKIRNATAHGDKSIVVSEDDLFRAISLVEKLMDLVFERIRDGYINESYRKPQS